MGVKQGCFKPALFGCLGIVVLGIVFVGITAMLARIGLKNEQIEEPQLAPMVGGAATLPAGKSGRVILELGQGEFEIRPAESKSNLTVKARFDREVFELVDEFGTLPDSTWVYRVRFRRNIPGLQALFRAMMGGDTNAYVHIYLPPDIPIALEVHAEEGEMVAELGGLWITQAEIRFAKGGFSLDVDTPTREPMERLTIIGRMGGFETSRLGNASPRTLEVDCKMGGAEIDLRGAWVQDCAIRLAVKMGGMEVTVPDDVGVQGLHTIDPGRWHENAEVPSPVLHFSVSESMGEIEIDRR
jgi:hypothetical protein